MSITSRAVLRAELHCVGVGPDVRTAQHWVDPQAPASRPVSWLRLVINGRVAQDKVFTGPRRHRELEVFWAQRVKLFAPTALTEAEMWSMLSELAGVEEEFCLAGRCGAPLPVAWSVCLRCRRDVRKVASGSMLTPAKRGIIWVSRRSPETP